MPDYFIGLVKQYGSATNDQQATYHAKAVVQAWFFTLNITKQQELKNTLPAYLQPKSQLFFHRPRVFGQIDQNAVMQGRLSVQLQKTDPKEVEQIIQGVFKALKVILDHNQKFKLSQLLDQTTLKLFIKA